MVIFAILDLMFNMTREDYMTDRINALENLSDRYLGLVEGDTSHEEEPDHDDSTEFRIYGDVYEEPVRHK